MSELTISVGQLNTYIKNIFDAEEMLIGVKVVGEITNLKPSGRATYFDLKDDSASIPCVAFDSYIIDGFNFGDKVTAKGKLNFYIKGGKLSFVVSKLEKYGVGDLYKQYLELKDKLEKEGVFDESYKKPLPDFVRRVGVVTSRTGAVIRDIIRVKNEKNHWSDVVLFPAKVQGIGAKEEIIKGIEFLDSYGVDVIIVARGGGSFEDYQPFNTEEVVRAVFNAKTPVVSAIGHENDWSLIDFVADRRASTPSVASEMVFFDESIYIQNLIKPLNNYLETIKRGYKKLHDDIVDKIGGIARLLDNKIQMAKGEVRAKSESLILNAERMIERKQARIDFLSQLLSKNNPLEVLSRGYTKTLVKNKVIKSVEGISVGDLATIILKDGEILAEVKEKINESR